MILLQAIVFGLQIAFVAGDIDISKPRFLEIDDDR
jgi:hypothetical protein